MDIQSILETQIPDIHPVYGGVRGRTLSSRHLNYAWPVIVEAGVKTVIDLRDGDTSDRLPYICEQKGIAYFHYPVDNKATCVESMVEWMPRFCSYIDKGDFYIACAMGLHRTDIALCTYWVFHAADRGFPPPPIVGYRQSLGHNTNKVMRVLNAIYACMAERNGFEPMQQEVFKARKKTIIEQSKV